MAAASAQLPLAEANAFTVMLVQALWGAISPNFRRVAISLNSQNWVVQFDLETDDMRDREMIDEVMEDFSCLISGYEPEGLSLEKQVIVTAAPLSALSLEVWRPVFQRREA